MSEAARQVAQLRALRAIAAMQEARALADLARLNTELATLRDRHQAIGEEVMAASRDASDPMARQMADHLRRWAEQRQAALNVSIARLAADREAYAVAAQRSVGRREALRDLIERETREQRRHKERG